MQYPGMSQFNARKKPHIYSVVLPAEQMIVKQSEISPPESYQKPSLSPRELDSVELIPVMYMIVLPHIGRLVE